MIVNEQLAGKLHKPVIKKFDRRKSFARFKRNTWEPGLTKMG